MTRTTRRNSEKKTENKPSIQGADIQRTIFLINTPLKTTSNLIFYKLRHPGTERKSYFHYCPDNKQLFQLIQMKEPNRCFFMNENISSNGNFNITIPFDVTFLFLYYIRKNCETKAMSIDQIDDSDYPELSKLLTELGNKDLLEKISDVKKSDSKLYFKYNKSKSLAWLAIKTKRLSEQLFNNKAVQIGGNNSSASSNYNKSESLQQVNKIEYLQQACDIVGNFLTKDLKVLLMEYLSITDIKNITKRKSTKLEEKNNKKFKSENNEEGNLIQSSPQQEIKKEKGPSNKELKLAKAAVGTKSIASFFGKK